MENIDKDTFIIEEENKSPLKLAIIFGVGMSILMFIIQLISRAITDPSEQSSNNWVMGVITYVILLICLMFFIIKHRDINCYGNIKYGKAFGAAMLCILFYSLFSSLFTYIWFTVDTDLLDEIRKKTLESIEKNNPDMDEDKIQQQVEMASKFQTPVIMTIASFFGNLLFGAILSLIGSAFNGSFRKKQIQ